MRNVRCKKYSECLANAIRKGLDTWGCDGCERRNNLDTLCGDLMGVHLLLIAIFKPEFYRLYRQAEQIQDKERLRAFQEQNRREYENAHSSDK